MIYTNSNTTTTTNNNDYNNDSDDANNNNDASPSSWATCRRPAAETSIITISNYYTYYCYPYYH